MLNSIQSNLQGQRSSEVSHLRQAYIFTSLEIYNSYRDQAAERDDMVL
jgi:hypothetical protein